MYGHHCSSDLNPIENLWSIIKQEVYKKRTYKTLKQIQREPITIMKLQVFIVLYGFELPIKTKCCCSVIVYFINTCFDVYFIAKPALRISKHLIFIIFIIKLLSLGYQKKNLLARESSTDECYNAKDVTVNDSESRKTQTFSNCIITLNVVYKSFSTK